MKYLIIGSGAAGVAAAETIRSNDSSGQITLLTAESAGYYSRPGLAYYLSGEISQQGLFPFTQADFSLLNIELLIDPVTEIHSDIQQVVTKSGRNLNYDRLLIATGASARKANYPGIDHSGVIYLDNFKGTEKIIQATRHAKRAVVIGGGITALELVEGLSARGIKTHYFLRGDQYWRSLLDKTESAIVLRRLKEEGVSIHLQTQIEKIVEKKSYLTKRSTGKIGAVLTKEGKEVKCDLVGIAIGVIPRIGLAKKSGIKVNKGILVDQQLNTSLPNIYAAGDVAETIDPLSGTTVIDSLWSLARDQGRVAGLNMAGIETPLRRDVAMNVTRLAGLTTTIIGAVGIPKKDGDVIGIIRGDSESWRHNLKTVVSKSHRNENRVRIMVGDNTLLGALVMGDQSLSKPLQIFISKAISIQSIREKLLSPNAPIAELLSQAWDLSQSKE